MSDLKPCPFCGSNPVFHGGPADNQAGELWWVYCESCCVSHTCEESQTAAAEAWNRRAQPAQAGQVLAPYHPLLKPPGFGHG